MPKLALRAQAVGIAVLPLRQSLMNKTRFNEPLKSIPLSAIARLGPTGR
jgi:hypothetical protein